MTGQFSPDHEHEMAALADGGTAPRVSGDERAAIVIVARYGITRKTLSEELSGRYGVDYQIVVCAEPADYLIREIAAAPNVDVRYHVQVVDGSGADRLETLVLEDRRTQTRQSVPAGALFVLIGAQPRTEWLGGTLARDRWGFILTGSDLLEDPDGRGAHWHADRPPLLQETSLPAVFAAGDVRRGSVKRVASAVGDGATTLPGIHRFLDGTAVATTPAR